MSGRGWRLVGWASLALALLCATVLAISSADERFPALARWTARFSGLLFLTAFSASSLQALWPGATTRWLLTHRRYLGLSFGVAHLVHGVAVLLVIANGGGDPDLLASVFGTTAYLFLLAMIATSFDRTAAWLGARRWKRLHTSGMWLLWIVFAFTWTTSAAVNPLSGLFAALTFAALGLRVAATLRVRRVSSGR